MPQTSEDSFFACGSEFYVQNADGEIASHGVAIERAISPRADATSPLVSMGAAVSSVNPVVLISVVSNRCNLYLKYKIQIMYWKCG